MQINKVLKCVILLAIGIGIIGFIKCFPDYTDKNAKIIIYICYFIFIFSFYYDNYYLSFAAYIIALLTVLFLREKVNINISDEDYIFGWLKIVFKNKTVFINVFGNLILYIPMVLFLNKKTLRLSLIILVNLAIIIILEVIQFITFRGVFDKTDIILNFIGVIFVSAIILIIRGIEYGRQEKERREKKRKD